MNGTEVEVKGKLFTVGTQVLIAGKTYQVYNTMPGLKLVGFAKVGRNGRLLSENMSLSFEQLERLMAIGSIN